MADKVPTLTPPKAQQAAPDSPFYDAANLPEKCSKAARWLFGNGWRCLGEPDTDISQWYSPGAVDYETSTTMLKKGWVWRQKGKKDAMGRPLAEQVEEVLNQQDGSPLGVLNVPVEQLVVTPAATAMNFKEAVKNQQIRDEAARRKVAQSQKQSA